MAKVIARVNRPALVLSHNKTLAAQLYGEFRSSSPTTPSSTSSATTTTTSPKPTCRRPTSYIEKEAIDQRGDRSPAPVGHQFAVRAARRDHRRQRVVHLRPRLARGVLRHDGPLGAASGWTGTRCCASSSTSSTSATIMTSSAASSAVRGDIVEICPAYEEVGLRVELVRRRSRRARRVRSADRPRHSTERSSIAVYPEVPLRHSPRPRERRPSRPSRRSWTSGSSELEGPGQAAGGASAWTSGRCSISR